VGGYKKDIKESYSQIYYHGRLTNLHNANKKYARNVSKSDD